MNRKVGDKYVRAWTNYYLFGKKGSSGYKHVQLQMVLRNEAPGPEWVFISTYSGYDIDEAWQAFFKISGWWDFVVRSTDPPVQEPQPAMF